VKATVKITNPSNAIITGATVTGNFSARSPVQARLQQTPAATL